MSASFCDCVNQWEQVVGLQVLRDTKYLSVQIRGGAAIRHYANQPARPFWLLSLQPVVEPMEHYTALIFNIIYQDQRGVV